jgi:hypothetical protein
MSNSNYLAGRKSYTTKTAKRAQKSYTGHILQNLVMENEYKNVFFGILGT